jgi:hypothetical protein
MIYSSLTHLEIEFLNYLYGIRAIGEIERFFFFFFKTFLHLIMSTEDYPYPMTQNVANFVSLHLSSTNFLCWKTQMMNILESYNLQGFVTRETKAPPQYVDDGENGSKPNPNFIKW